MFFSKITFAASALAVALATPSRLEQRDISGVVSAAASHAVSVENNFNSVLSGFPQTGATNGQAQSLYSATDAVISALNDLAGTIPSNPTSFSDNEAGTVLAALGQLSGDLSANQDKLRATSGEFNALGQLSTIHDKFVALQSATGSVISAVGAKASSGRAVTNDLRFRFSGIYPSVILSFE